MTDASDTHADAFRLFRLQIQSVVNDERATQLALYSDDLVYHFPFAHDRPRSITGRRAFQAVMEPIWQRRRDNHIALSVGDVEFHATDEAGLYLATFVLTATDGTGSTLEPSPCVQLLRIRDGHIVEVREFFEP